MNLVGVIRMLFRLLRRIENPCFDCEEDPLVRDTWGAPAAGWPTFDENGRRIRDDAEPAEEPEEQVQ
jgi:hypothetical protein